MAVEFDDVTNNYVTCGAAASLDDIFASGGSAVGWFYVDDYAQYHGLFGKNNTTPNNGWEAFTNQTSGTITFTQRKATVDGGWDTTSALGSGAWKHVAIVYDASNDANDPTIYVNGVSQSLTEIAAPSGAIDSDGPDPLVFAAIRTNAFSLDGKAEDVRMYKRLLSQEEVSLLAAGYRGPLGNEQGWWSGDNFRGITHPDGTTLTAATNYLRDESGNGNTGDPIGGVIARASDAPRMGMTF